MTNDTSPYDEQQPLRRPSIGAILGVVLGMLALAAVLAVVLGIVTQSLAVILAAVVVIGALTAVWVWRMMRGVGSSVRPIQDHRATGDHGPYGQPGAPGIGGAGRDGGR